MSAPRSVRPKRFSMNVTDLNSTHLDMYIIPAQNRHQTTRGFNISSLNFTWEAVLIENNYLFIQLNFTSFASISALDEWDLYQVRINKSHTNLFYSEDLEVELHPNYHTLNFSIQPQMEYQANYTSFISALGAAIKTLLTTLFLLSIFLNIMLGGSMTRFITMLRTLQIMMHLPMLKIIVPGCVIYLFKNIIPITQWDIFEDSLLDTRQWLPNKEKGDPILGQMKQLGYKTYNAVDNLGSISIFWMFYFIKVAILLALAVVRI